MFTVKHISPDGSEQLWTATEVKYDPRYGSAGVGTSATGKVEIDFASGGSWHLYEGTVFVMNDAGKTVQRYNLSEPAPMPVEPIVRAAA